MKIYLPNSAFLGNIDSFLKSVDMSENGKLEISMDDKWVSVHPMVLSMTAALGLKCGRENITFLKNEVKSGHYLERMRLFDLLGIESKRKIQEHESAGRFVPLTKITTDEDLTKFITEVIPLLHLPPEQTQPVRYVVSELTRNVFEHSGSKIGAVVCAQYYKKINMIRLGIADVGVGVKKTIAVSHLANTDLEAVGLALTPGITGTTKKIGGTDFNVGAGLFFIRSIAKVNRNYFVIYSGNAMYKLLKAKGEKAHLWTDPFRDRHSKREDLPYWQGTVVGVDISLGDNQTFSELLGTISQAFSKSIRERKKDYYRKARFI